MTQDLVGLEFDLSPAAVAEAVGWVLSHWPEGALAPQTRHAMRLCLEEALTNILTHADDGCYAGTVRVTSQGTKDAVIVTVMDWAAAFDPTAHPITDAAHTIEDAAIGGRGIGLMRAFSRALTYAWVDGCNVLTLEFDRYGAET